MLGKGQRNETATWGQKGPNVTLETTPFWQNFRSEKDMRGGLAPILRRPRRVLRVQRGESRPRVADIREVLPTSKIT